MEATLRDLNDEIPQYDDSSKSMRDFLYSETGSAIYREILDGSQALTMLHTRTKDILIAADLSDSEHPGDIIERHMNSIKNQE